MLSVLTVNNTPTNAPTIAPESTTSFSTETAKVLDVVSDRLGVAVDWTAENVVPYVEKLFNSLVKYEIATSIAWIAIFIAAIIITSVLLKVAQKRGWFEEADDDEVLSILMTILVIVFVVSIFVGLIVICVQVFDIVMCYTFPEKLILNEIKDFIAVPYSR